MKERRSSAINLSILFQWITSSSSRGEEGEAEEERSRLMGMQIDLGITRQLRIGLQSIEGDKSDACRMLNTVPFQVLCPLSSSFRSGCRGRENFFAIQTQFANQSVAVFFLINFSTRREVKSIPQSNGQGRRAERREGERIDCGNLKIDLL